VKKNPLGAVAIVLVAGALIGGLAALLVTRKREPVEC